MPSTSVQIHSSSASSTAARMDAEKSEPPRPSVVGRPSRVAPLKPVHRLGLSGLGMTQRIQESVGDLRHSGHHYNETMGAGVRGYDVRCIRDALGRTDAGSPELHD